MSEKHSHYHEELTAKKASKLNYILGASQGIVGLIIGNFGFIPDSLHNIGDGVSFSDKAKATDEDNRPPDEVSRLRTRSARVLGATGIFGFVGAAVSMKIGHSESTDTIALGAAYASAVVNTVVAKMTHEHDHTEIESSEAFKDATLHAYTDFGTSWIYAASLIGERYLNIPDLANYAIAMNGMATTAIAGYTLKKID